MKILKEILKYFWPLLKLGIWVGIIFWATQLASTIAENAHREHYLITSAKAQIFENEREAYVKEVVSEAKKVGAEYGAKHYFQDLKRLEKKNCELQVKHQISRPLGTIGTDALQYLVGNNMKVFMVGIPPRESFGDFERERKKFDEWYGTSLIPWVKANKPNDLDIVINFSNSSGLKESDSVSNFADWLKTFYQRGFFLALALFLIRVIERDELLKTLKRDSGKFSLAVFLWPIYIFKYPYNVFKEMVIEAEIRRYGDLFRKLSDQERLLVRRVASQKGLIKWIRDFREEHSHLFERSLLTALLALVLIHSFGVETQASSFDLVRAGPVIEFLLDVDQDGESEDTTEEEFNFFDSDFLGLEEDKFHLYNFLIALKYFQEKSLKKLLICFQIEHIPLYGILSTV